MKAKLKNESHKNVTTTSHVRGRKQIELRFPRRPKFFTVEDAVKFNHDEASPATVRARLNEMTQKGKASAVSVPGEGRGHPKYLFNVLVS